MTLLIVHRKIARKTALIFVILSVLIVANILWGYFNKRPLIIMIGDSSTVDNIYLAPVLEKLLTLQPKTYVIKNGKDLNGAKVVNLGIAGFTSGAWISTPTPESCTWAREASDDQLHTLVGIRVLRNACEKNISPINALASTLGRTPYVALITLGTNGGGETPEDTINNLKIIRDTLGSSVTTLFASPFRTYDGRQARLEVLTKLMQEQGMLTGPNFNDYSTNSFAAAAGLWFDALLVLR